MNMKQGKYLQKLAALDDYQACLTLVWEDYENSLSS